ncbi:MAG: alanine dehydrogenase [Campylobacterota bacterium]|nr:alanine dehydrogenase [Campylobacterota bacterium]
MNIGVVKEIKTDEFRVGLTPSNVEVLVQNAHKVFVQSSAGDGSGFSDAAYKKAGAMIVDSAKDLYDSASLIVKVKEPQPSEYEYLNESHTLFCYFHLVAFEELASVLVEKKVCAIAYETVSLKNELPLLKPMSEIAGKMAPIAAAFYLSRFKGGEGILIGGAVGVRSANVLVIGAGNAGYGAAKVAMGMGADVTVMNRSTPKLEKLQAILPFAKTAIYSPQTLSELLQEADIVIATVLIQGGSSAPKLISSDMLKSMKKGSIIVDVAIDQGGVSVASKPTTHREPIFTYEGVIHYCVANMPGAYPKTSTLALTNATMPYVLKLANEGIKNAIKNDEALLLGVNALGGNITNAAVASALGYEYKSAKELLREIL